MGMTSSRNPGKLLTADKIPLFLQARGPNDAVRASPDSNEWYLKCHAPSAERHHPGDNYDYGPAKRFVLKAYVPPASTSVEHVCVIFNGLDETPHGLTAHELFGLYDSLGNTLANRGFLALLLPSPFHLNRSLAYTADGAAAVCRKHDGAAFADLTLPSHAMIRHPENLYINHYQSFRELISLCRDMVPGAFAGRTERSLETICARGRLLEPGAREFLSRKVSPSAHISLIGYSMGGLRVMTAFAFAWDIALRHDERPLFTSCVAINSGGSFSNMNPPSWIDRAQWLSMIRRLDMDDFRKTLKRTVKRKFNDEADCFWSYSRAIRDITLGNAITFRDLNDRDTTFTRRLLFILGGSDDIMNLQALQRLTPPGGLNIFQVASAGHLLRHGRWGAQLGGMMSHVASFIDASTREADDLSSRDLVEFLSLVDREFGILPYDSLRLRTPDRSAEVDDAGSGTTDLHRAGEDVQDGRRCDPAGLARLILRPLAAGEPDGAAAARDLTQAIPNPALLDSISTEAQNFVRFRLLDRLQTQIDTGACHPGLYKEVRRSLLLGWMIWADKEIIEHWKGLATQGKRLGQTLVDLGLLPEERVDDALALQRARLEGIRQRMHAAFADYCDNKEVRLPEPLRP